MAVVKNNIVTDGMQGMIGGTLVFRKRRGRTIASATPRRRTTKTSAAQQRQRHRLEQANAFAKQQMANPELKERYNELARTRRQPSGFSVAVADFFSAPEIFGVDLRHYTGAAGSTILIRAEDDFDVKNVSVAIHTASGALVEAGAAHRAGPTATLWVYTAAAANTALAGSSVVITAVDFAGNATTEQRAF